MIYITYRTPTGEGMIDKIPDRVAAEKELRRFHGEETEAHAYENGRVIGCVCRVARQWQWYIVPLKGGSP